MKDQVNLEEISTLLHLSKAGADIYITLMVHGTLTREEVKSLTGIPEAVLDESLHELASRDFVAILKNAQDGLIYEPLSLMQLEERLDRQKNVIKNLKQFVIPSIQPPKKLGIVKYEGLEGVRRVYVEVLEEAREVGEDILAFERSVDASSIGSAFIESYVKKRIEFKVNAYVISPYTTEDSAYKAEYEGLYTYVKLIPDLEIGANINIVGDLVMTFSLEPAEGTLRRNMAEATTLKAIFHKIWDMA